MTFQRKEVTSYVCGYCGCTQKEEDAMKNHQVIAHPGLESNYEKRKVKGSSPRLLVA